MNDIVISGLEKRFVDSLEVGVKSFAEAGKMLVELIDADATAIQRLKDKRNIPASLLRTLEKIGRGLMLPEMFSEPTLARLPISEQKQILAGPVDMLTFSDGKATTLKVDLMTAGAEVRAQVVNGNHIRSISEQRAYVEAAANARLQGDAKAQPPAWRVVGKVIRVRAGVELTQSDLVTMQRALIG